MPNLLRILSPIYKPLGEDIFCTGKKFLVLTLVNRNLKIKYRDSIFGILWTLLTPIAMTAVYYYVFKVVLRVKIPYHAAFILSGVLAWNFIGQSLLEGMESIVGSIGLITKVPLPLQVFPFVGSVTNFVTFLLAMPVLLTVVFISGIPITSVLLIFPFYAALLFLMVYGLSLSLALLFVKLRDLRHLTGIILQIWFYATPVIYDEKMIPEKYAWILDVNPFGYVFADLHSIWIYQKLPSTHHIGVVCVWTVSIILFSATLQKYLSKGLVEQI